MFKLHIAVDGDDSWTGLEPDSGGAPGTGPIRTLSRARDLIRKTRAVDGLPVGGVSVLLRGGCYFLEAPFVLEKEDSGTEEAPIVYRSFPGESARIIGGKRLTGFRPVTDAVVRDRLPKESRDQVVQIDLPALGITDFGEYRNRGSGVSEVAPLELFFDREPMTVARWPKKSILPNRDFERIADVRGTTLIYTDPRPARWKSQADIFLHGYFRIDWASSIARVTALRPATREIETDPPGGDNNYTFTPGGRFFYFNVLDELSQPGEWYLDRHTGMLYFLPPAPVATGETIVSCVTAPLIRLHDASHVRLERLVVECTRDHGLEILGGRQVTVAGCTIRNTGREGVRMEGGERHALVSCDIHDTGDCGVWIPSAGDRATLTPCGHRIHNCHFHHNGRGGRTFFPAINMAGCGITATHNLIRENTHVGLAFPGNDHLIEFNEFYNLTLETDDCGCIYIGRDFTCQGTVIRHNYFHHVGGSGRSWYGSSGVYVDDCAGGVEVVGNVFLHAKKGVIIGGGVNGHIRNNIMVSCEPAVHFDERGASARAEETGNMVHGCMRQAFYALKANEPPFSEKYPSLDRVHRALQAGTGILAWNAQVSRNIAVRSIGHWFYNSWTSIPEYVEVRDNMIGEDPRFVDADFGVLQLRDDSPAYSKIGFERIPFEEIGLVRDEYRREITKVLSAIEVIRPVSPGGKTGSARLLLRNVGDVAVAGAETIEFKTQRNGPGVAEVTVPYAVAPGEQAAFEFEVALETDKLQGVLELFLCSRGNVVQPARTRMPIAYTLELQIDRLTPVVAGQAPCPGRLRLTARNVGRERVCTKIQLHLTPAADGVLDKDFLNCELSPGQELSAEFTVTLANSLAGRTLARLSIEARGDGVKPVRETLTVEHPVLRIAALDSVTEVAEALRDAMAYPAGRNRGPHLAADGLADLRFAVAGEELAVHAVVRDGNIGTTDMLWDGSCIEIFACTPDREKISEFVGGMPIGHAYLVPGTDKGPVPAYLHQNNHAQPAPAIRVASTPDKDGYSLSALIPLRLLSVNSNNRSFLFECEVNTGKDRDGRSRRMSLFGSREAYRETSGYALAVVNPGPQPRELTR